MTSTRHQAPLVLLLLAGCGETGEAPVPCTSDSDCAALDSDSDRCNGTFRCEGGTCVAAPAPVVCKGGAPCAPALCEPATGQCKATTVPDGTPCIDLDPCTYGDHCMNGACVSSEPTCTDDGDPCTKTTCTPAGSCIHEPLPALSACDDGNPCTAKDVCIGGNCSGSLVECPEDEDPCTKAVCTIQGGCHAIPAPDGIVCDDGDPCTEGDACAGGLCTPGSPKCADGGPCMAVACNPGTGECEPAALPDGEPCDDGDPCTAGDTCQLGMCAPGGAKCEAIEDPCVTATCNPGTGTCGSAPVPGGPACDDGDPCTVADACVSGTCVGDPKPCPEDGNPCTDPTCEDGVCGQAAAEAGTGCDDADPCTTADACGPGAVCAGAPACPPDASPCTLETCDPSTGACASTEIQDGGGCEDGNPCTEGETCTALVCSGGTAVVCGDDGNPCTLETCLPDGGGCLHIAAPDGSWCDDGNPCTEGETCQGGACGSAELAECPDDGNPCTAESCDPGVGCAVTPEEDGTECSDSDACTIETLCQAGECLGAPLPCQPKGPCHIAACEATDGCLQSALPNGTPCDDGDACTQGTTCASGTCTGGAPPPACPQPGDPCKVATCDPASGLCVEVPAADGKPCDDGDLCTSVDTCQGGACAGGKALDCGPGPDPCVMLECDPYSGKCAQAALPDGADCDVDNPCTSAGTCAGGKCTSEPIVKCPPSALPCQVAVCDPTSGACVEKGASDGTSCDDGNPCTAGTTCAGGVCTGGAPVVCPDDGDACSAEVCEPGKGCTAKPVPDGAHCSDGDPCTDGTTCGGGKCAGGMAVACPPDGSQCTSDACQPGKGCTYPVLADGSTCDDGSLCTSGDACKAGVCAGVAAVQCEPGAGPCKPNVCQPATGKCALAPATDGVPCDDGNVCTQNDTCKAGLCIGAAPPCPKEEDPCKLAQCDPASGKCVSGLAPAGKPCDDGRLCTTSDVCDGKGKCGGQLVLCPKPEAQCHQAACDEASGKCVVSQAEMGVPCEDGLPCTAGDYCLFGECVSGPLPACTPSTPCAVATCAPDTGACSEVLVPDGSPCEDGNPCTFGETCFGAECGSGSEVECPADGNQCTVDGCNSLTGMCESHAAPEGVPCDDGDACTELDACHGGSCVATLVECDEPADPCRAAECDPTTGACKEIPAGDGAPCDDQDLCTEGEVCAGGSCTGEPVLCPPPQTTCLASACEPEAGCFFEKTNEGGACNDNVCFVGSTCKAGVCSGGQPLQCSKPAKECHVAYCTQSTGCTTGAMPDGTPCEDKDLCTANESCVLGKCAGAPAPCPAPPPCHAATCNPAHGCQTKPLGDDTPCDDGDPCTAGDLCSSGVCLPGAQKKCPSAVCMAGFCSQKSGTCGLDPLPDGVPCDDGDPCTAETTCLAGICGGGDPVVCGPAKGPCKQAICSPAAGGCAEVPLPDGTACDDGSACTSQDVCSGGTCAGLPAVFCPAPSGCLANVCDSKTGGCVPKLAPDGAPCDDDDPCTAGETCKLGKCGGGAGSSGCCAGADECDDGNACTTDTCSAAGCAHEWDGDLSACVTRLVVAGGEVAVIDPQKLETVPGTPVPVEGEVAQLAVAPRSGVVFAALPAGNPGVAVLDPLLPGEIPASPALPGGALRVAADDSLGVLAVVLAGGGVRTFGADTAQALGSGLSLPVSAGRPAVDPSTHRLYAPSSSGWLHVVSLDPLSAVPSAPWPVGGTLARALLDVEGARVLLTDPKAEAIRVLGASHGAGLAQDPIGGYGQPAGVAVDLFGGRLLVAYPSKDVIRLFDLATLAPATPSVVAVPGGPGEVAACPMTGRIAVSCAQGPALHVLDGATLLGVPGSPLQLPSASVDMAFFHSAPGPLLVNEVMLDPVVPDVHGEWIELYNPGKTALFLDGWTLSTQTSTHEVQDETGLVVPPGGLVLLCREADSAKNGNIANCDYDYNGLALANTGVVLTLASPDGVLRDTARLSSPIPSGQSLALRHPAYDNGRRYSFSPSAGTPGAPNDDVMDSVK